MITKKSEVAITEHARREYPREACGLLVAVGRKEVYRACKNIAAGKDHFVIDPEDYMAAEEAGKIIAVAHSHPGGPAAASIADRISCENSGVPWFILPFSETGEPQPMTRIEPCGYSQPLLGRPFFHGVLDCYTLIRDWYQRERGITLKDFVRLDGWWNTDKELYLDHFEEAGFKRLDSGLSLQTGDVILMQLRSDRTNHGGVYLGNAGLAEDRGLHPLPNALLHHVYGYLSERVIYGGYWMQNTRCVVRYHG